MANYFPLIVKTVAGNTVNELPAGDFLDLSSGGIANSGNITLSSTSTLGTGFVSASGNITAAGNVSGNYLLGNGTFITGLSASKIFNGTSEANIGTSGGNANVTIGGTSNVVVWASTGEYVTGLISATGNITGGNVIVGTDLYVGAGATTAGFTTSPIIVGRDASATYVQVAIQNGTGTGSTDYAAYANNGTEAAGWVDIGVTGNTFNDANYTVTGANDGYLFAQGNASFGGNLVIATGNTGTTKDIVFATGGFLTASIKARLVNATGAFSVVGNIIGGNVLGGANVNATTHTGATVSVSGAVTSASVVGGVMTGTSLSVSGAVTGGAITGSSLTVSTGNIAGGNVNNNNTTGVGNIGSATVAFNTVFAKATSAQYADLAERYVADADYAPGTVLEFGGEQEVTISNDPSSPRIAGVVSTNPAHVMNSDQAGKHTVVVALTGRVPTSVIGTVRKGDMMVSAGNGRAVASASPQMGTVIGKALENFDAEHGVIEIVVGRL